MLTTYFTWAKQIESSKVNINRRFLCSVKLVTSPGLVAVYNSLVLLIFDYAAVVWKDKDNVVLMNELQVLQNKVAKVIFNRYLHSSASDTL